MHHPGGVAMKWSGVGRLQQPSSGRIQTRGDSCWTIQGLRRNMEMICYSRSGVRSEHSSCSDPWAVSSPTHGRSFGAHFDSYGQAPSRNGSLSPARSSPSRSRSQPHYCILVNLPLSGVPGPAFDETTRLPAPGGQGLAHSPALTSRAVAVPIRDDQVVVTSQFGSELWRRRVGVGSLPPGTLRVRGRSSHPGRPRGASQCPIVATLVALMTWSLLST